MMNDEVNPAVTDRERRHTDLFFDFLDEVIDRPEVLERVPAEGQVACRSVALGGYAYLLAAFKPPADAGWTAHVVRYTLTDGAPAVQRPASDDRSEIHDPDAIVREHTAIGAAAAAALDALEHDLRARIEEDRGVPATTGQRSAD